MPILARSVLGNVGRPTFGDALMDGLQVMAHAGPQKTTRDGKPRRLRVFRQGLLWRWLRAGCFKPFLKKLDSHRPKRASFQNAAGLDSAINSISDV